MSPGGDVLPDLSSEERAELHALRDFRQTVAFVDDDGSAVIRPWIDAHKTHADEPYIGCPFCRDKFVRVDTLRYRAVVTDVGNDPEFLGPCDSLEEAQQLVRDEMDGADPPYDSGWVEFQATGAWQHVSSLGGR